MTTQPGFETCSVESYFIRERRLDRFVTRLHRAGIETIGDLISIPEAELFRKVPTTEDNKKRLREALSRVELTLNSQPS